jgi:hypothetical protein
MNILLPFLQYFFFLNLAIIFAVAFIDWRRVANGRETEQVQEQWRQRAA